MSQTMTIPFDGHEIGRGFDSETREKAGCASSAASPELRSLVASNEVPGFVVDELGKQGFDLEAQAAA